jgi:glutamine amidotransferase-like uncharacterized protein
MTIDIASRWRLLFAALAGAAIFFGTNLARAQSSTWVAVYDHSGGTAKGPKNLASILTAESGFRCEFVTPEEIRDGRLEAFDVVIMPGGSGSKQSASLSEEGRRQIQEFVKGGGGYVGICAGSYLASSYYDWSLHLINAQVVDREHWARGTGQVQLDLTDAGQTFFQATTDDVEVYYGQGPLLAPDSKPDLPAYEPLATYATEIAKKGAPSGVMVGTTAIATASYGEGRVICYSPHCEVTDGPRHMITKGVLWAAGRDPQPATSTPAAAAQ